MEQKKIIEAAIRWEGKIYTGHRHHQIIETMRKEHKIIEKTAIREQGFVLDDGSFIDRLEGARIALESGQVKKLIAPPYLYSEDLY